MTLLETHPDLALQLVDGSLAKSLTKGSHKSVEWKCNVGHVYSQAVYRKALAGYGCPVCSNRIIVPGVNDLATLHPELAMELHPDNKLDPTTVSPGSKKKALWQCSEGHSWETTVGKRVSRGDGCPVHSGRKCSTGANDLLSVDPELSREWHSDNDKSAEDVTRMSHYMAKWRCTNGHEWHAAVYNRSQGQGCPRCSTSGTSKKEIALADYVETLVPIVRNARSVIPPQELDIYIPSKNIAVEFNGLYWHTEDKVGQEYHYKKWLACHTAGVQLITIWEDQWDNNQDVVKRMLESKINGRPGIGARNTVLKDIPFSDSARFLNYWHIQGKSTGTWHKGLYCDGELVAVGVFKKMKDDVYLERYAASMSISGGLQKMMKSIGADSYVTFADLSVSNGRLYEATGWTEDSILKPDYKYLYNGMLVHKFNFRLKRFRSDPLLQYAEGLSERQLAVLNNIPRVYDCGKVRYVLKK